MDEPSPLHAAVEKLRRVGELRIDPGTVYEEKPPEFETALAQGRGFSDKPEADPWGVWVTAAEALHAPDGKVDGILGVDFPAQEWATLQDRARFPALLLGTAVTWLFLGSWSMTLRLRKERAAAGARACELARERSLLEQMVENETRLSEESLHVDPSAA